MDNRKRIRELMDQAIMNPSDPSFYSALIEMMDIVDAMDRHTPQDGSSKDVTLKVVRDIGRM